MWETIKKFGLAHCDLPTMLWNVSFMLRGLTLNIDNRYTDPIPWMLYVSTPLLAFCYLYAYFVSMLWFVFVRCRETRDLVAAMIAFSLGITSQIGVAKFFNTCFYREQIRTLFQEYLEYDATIVPDSRFSVNLLKGLRSVKRRALIYWVIIVANGILYILKPLATPGRQTMEDAFILYKMEPQFETPYFQLSYFFSAAGSVLTCYLTSNMAAFLIIVAGYVEAQLLALSEELLLLWDDSELEAFAEQDDDNEDSTAINKLVQVKLKQIIMGHTKAINLLQKVESIFKGAFAFEFIILSVGLIAELLGGLKNTYMQVPFAIIQVGMDCLTGQRVIDASLVFEDAVYSCKWEKFNSSNMRIVLIMLINAQKTLTLSAGGITILSFVTLMSVFRSIYSAFTTLQSVM